MVALVTTLACLVLLVLAGRGLLRGGVPQTPDFGTAAAVAVDDRAEAAQQPAGTAGGSAAATSPSSGPSASATTGSLPRPDRSPALPPPVQQRPVPVALAVPSLGLAVDVEPVSVAEDGQMSIPDEPDRAGWYRFGPAPGDRAGSVVVAGHVDTTSGPGAFLTLTRVREGAEVVLELADGSSAAYRVVGGEQVAKADLAVEEIFRRDGAPVLRLVTCSGDWSPRTGHYTDNLVITAEPVG